MATKGGPRPYSGAPKKMVEWETLPTPQMLRAAPETPRPMPEVKDWMVAAQENGEELTAASIYAELDEWMRMYHAYAAVPPLLLQQYAMCVARWVQAEQALSKYGLLALKADKSAMESPYAKVGREYLKQANNLWYSINQLIAKSGVIEDSDEL